MKIQTIQTLKIDSLVIKTSNAKILRRKIEKLLIAEANRNWEYTFKIEN